MSAQQFHIDGPALLIAPVHRDARGVFMESYHAPKTAEALGYSPHFLQDNLSYSERAGTLRGMHLQTPPFAQGKLVQCIAGEILDVIVDVRRGSPTFGEHVKVELSAGDGQSFWVPEGFLHGFVTRADQTIISYKVTAHYDKASDVSVRWDDPELGIDWGLSGAPILSEKDADGLKFSGFTSPFEMTL